MPSIPPTPTERGMVRVILTRGGRVRSHLADPACAYITAMLSLGWTMRTLPTPQDQDREHGRPGPQ